MTSSPVDEFNNFRNIRLKAIRARQVQEEMAKRLAIVGGGALGAAGAGAAGAGYLGYKALGGGAEPDAVPAND
jgi:predicted Rossmann-fold nucleotide-binding protein